MFDIGFSELVVCGIVALVVIGPERLPRVARTLGVLFARMQRYVTQVKSDINRELELAELGKVRNEFETAARSFQTEVESHAAQAEREMREAQTSIERELADKAAPQAAPPQEPEAPPSPQLELGLEDPARSDKPVG